MSNEFKPGVTVKNAPSPENGAVSNAEEREFSEKETANQMRQHEEDFIQGLIDASGYTQEEHKIIEIARKGKVYFQFSIRPLSENEKLWDNKKVWDAMRNNGLQIMNGLDVIEYSLIAGEKEKIVEQIDRISGFEDDSLEEVTKN